MYAGQLGEQVLSFGVSGMLYRDGLVMYDRETDTLWTQVDGKAVKGSLSGRTLAVVPSVHATWKQWKQLYPNRVVLKKRGIPRSAYDAYNRDPNQTGILGRRGRDKRLPPKERIVGVRLNDAAVAFAEKDVRDARLVQACAADDRETHGRSARAHPAKRRTPAPTLQDIRLRASIPYDCVDAAVPQETHGRLDSSVGPHPSRLHTQLIHRDHT